MSFSANVSDFGKRAVVSLKENETGTSVEVFSFGALLNRFSIVHDDAPFNVVDGFLSLDDAVENLTPFFKSAKLSPFACRVKNGNYKFGNDIYQLSKYSSSGNAMHGLIYDADYSVKTCEADDKRAAVTLQYLYDNGFEGFPFRYQSNIEYKLEEGNRLTVTTTIENKDDKLMPIVDGWHPYFTLGDSIDEYQVEFQSKEMLEFDDDLIPTGRTVPYEEFGSLRMFGPTKFDNCFTLNFGECPPMCVLRNKERKLQLEFYPERSYPYLQIYTPDHRKSIAIENLSAAPDAFNNGMGLKVISEGESTSFAVTFIIRPNQS